MPLRLVIIGAGPAGFRAAEVLRQQAPEADILLIGDEPHPPYQRPPLSKEFLTKGLNAPPLYLHPASFFGEQRIGLKLGSPALRIDRAVQSIELADGERIGYDKLLLATGCRGRTLPPALGHASVRYLRNLSDAHAIRAAVRPGSQIVMIGGGFIGLEIAASAATLGASVMVLEAAPRLMMRTMPAVVGDYARALHERHGVRFEFEAQVKSIEADGGGRVTVRTGCAVHGGDLVIAGVGAVPNTELAEAAGLAVENGIRVDAWGRTSDEAIFAAGDVTRHDNPLLGRPIRVESWQVALNQAAAVARAMLGAAEPYAEIPWMWTDQYESNIQVLGLPEPDLELIVRGDPKANNFTVLGLDADQRIAAAITVNNGRDMSALRRLAASGTIFPKDVLSDPARKLTDLAKAASRPS